MFYFETLPKCNFVNIRSPALIKLQEREFKNTVNR